MSDGALRSSDPLEATVVSLDELGAGIACVRKGADVLRVHVAGALPGERVRARLVHVSVHRRGEERDAWAELVSLLTPSPDRVAPECGLHRECGSCALAGLAYPAQLDWKQERIGAELARHRSLAGVTVDRCVPAPATTGYRNQAKYVYGQDHVSGRLVLGGFAPRSHRIVDLAGCRVVEPPLDRARQALLAILTAEQIAPFDEHRRTGVLRYVVMRVNAMAQVMVTLVAARRDFAEAHAIAKALVAACPAVAAVVLNVNPTGGNRIFGDEEHVLLGQPYLEDRVGEVTVRLSSRSFSQANRAVAARIYRDIVAAAPARVRRAVDAYAGAAPIALSLAGHADEVVAIESNAAATAAAAAFIAAITGLSHVVRVVTGDAGQCLQGIPSAELVVLDPPRRGCAPDVLAAVARLRPHRIAYLSCDPRTLGRDLAALVGEGARLLRVTPYDMMPHTPHVEVLALASYDVAGGADPRWARDAR